ncbi:hypothetical protein V8C43DRAFT_275086 [Trichoderma afarasin]
MLILSTVLYSVQQAHHLASLCTRRDGRADATMRATWTLPAQLLHIAGYVPTGMEHSVTASGFRRGARSPFSLLLEGQSKTGIVCINVFVAKRLHLETPPWLSLEAMPMHRYSNVQQSSSPDLESSLPYGPSRLT